MPTADTPELPGDLHAEQGVLGAMLLSPDAAALAADMLTIEDFYRQAHQLIFSAAVSAIEESHPCDLLTVGNVLKGRGQIDEAGGHEYLLAIMQCVPAVDHIERYARILREQTNRRRLIALARATESRALSNDCFHDVMTWTLDQMLRLADSDDACGGLRFCNWKELDAHYGQIEWVWDGWLPRGMVSILAAEPGIGKTACAMGLAGVVTAGGTEWPDGAPGPTTPERVVFIETENRTHLLMERIRAWSIDGFEVVRQLPAEGRAVVDIASPTQQRAIAGAIKRTGARLLIIDSLSAGHTLEENSDDMKRLLLDLCRLAAETNVALLAIHHLRKRGKAEPLGVSLDRLRGSSTIAQLAVVTLTLERPDRELPNLVLRQIKNNVAPEQDPIGLEITSDGIRWSGDVPDDVDAAQQRERATAEAANALITQALRDGPRRTAELVEEAAGIGVGRTTLYEEIRRMGLRRPQKGIVALPEALPHPQPLSLSPAPSVSDDETEQTGGRGEPEAPGEGPHERTCPVVQGHASDVGPAVDVPAVPEAPGEGPHERTCPVVQGHASEVGPAVDVPAVPEAPGEGPPTTTDREAPGEGPHERTCPVVQGHASDVGPAVDVPAVPEAPGEGPHERTCPVVQGHASEVGPAVDVSHIPDPAPHAPAVPAPASPPPEPSLGPDFAALAERAFPESEYPSGGTKKAPVRAERETGGPEPPPPTRIVHGAGCVPSSTRVP